MQVSDLDHDMLVKAATQHIASLGTTLYGKMRDVTKSAGRNDAAEWLVNEIEHVLKQYTINHYRAVGIDITKNGQDPRTDDRLA